MTEELTALNTIQSVLTQIETQSGGTYNRATMSLQAIAASIATITTGTGTATLANQNLIKDNNTALFTTGDDLHIIRNVLGRTIFDGTAGKALESTPYDESHPIVILQNPQVAQGTIIVAYQTLANINGAVPALANITPGTFLVDRFRLGTDADWVNIVVATALTASAGLVSFSYAFPAASWQTGDLVRVKFTGTTIATSGKTFSISDAFAFTKVLGIAAIDSVLNALPEHILGNKSDTAQTDGGATRSIVAHAKGILSQINNTTFGLSAINTRIGTPAGVSVSADIAAIKTDTGTASTNTSTILTRIGTPTGASVSADIATLNGLNSVPAVNAITNVNMRDVIGNKSDSTIGDTLAFTNLSEYRYLLTLQRVFKEVIPRTDSSLAAIDNILTVAPTLTVAGDVANTVLFLGQVAGTTYCLRDVILNVTNFGTGATMSIKLWKPVNNVMTNIKTVLVGSAVSGTVDFVSTDFLTLVDMFGLPEIFSDAISITAQTDLGATGALSFSYNYAVSRVS